MISNPFTICLITQEVLRQTSSNFASFFSKTYFFKIGKKAFFRVLKKPCPMTKIKRPKQKNNLILKGNKTA